MLKRITKYQTPAGPLPTYLFDPAIYTPKEKPAKKSFIEHLAEAAAMSRDARTGAAGAQQVRDLYNQGKTEEAQKLAGQYFMKNVEGLGTALLLPEFTTYGLLGGGARLLGGSLTAGVGSYALGKAGDYADKQFDTDFLGKTGRVVGGFAGFGAGMGATTPILRRLATKGVTLHMPQETFMKLRSEGFHKNADRVAKSLFKTKHIVNPEEQLMNEITDVQKGKGWQFHVDDFYKTPNTDWETGKSISTSFNKQYYENGLIKPGKSYIDSSGESDYIWFKEDTPYIKPKHSNIIKGLSEDLNAKTNQLVSGQPNPFPLSKGFDPNKPSIEIYEYYPLGNIKMNPKLHLKDQSVGTWGKVKFHTPKQPQPSATTYEVKSLRVPTSVKPYTEEESILNSIPSQGFEKPMSDLEKMNTDINLFRLQNSGKYPIFITRKVQYHNNTPVYGGIFPTKEMGWLRNLIEKRIQNFQKKKSLNDFTDLPWEDAKLFNQSLLDNVTKKPVYLTYDPSPNSFVAWFDPNVNESYINIAKQKPTPITTLLLHDGVMHPTDDVIKSLSTKIKDTPVINLYKDIAKPSFLKTFPDATKLSQNWTEARATNGELMHLINTKIAQQYNLPLEHVYKNPKLLEYYVDSNLRTPNDVVKILNEINSGYSTDYAKRFDVMDAKQKEIYSQRIKDMIKRYPVWLGVLPFLNQEKK